jgi:hypothetical protein
MALALLSGLFSALTDLARGFAFGTGYGSGVRFGFEDVYPFFKGNAQKVMGMFGFNDPVIGQPSQSGFKQASGLNKFIPPF